MPKIADTGKASIIEAHKLLNRSIAYHFQVNARNPLIDTATGSSKFTFDIDKEGQFKVNVPRSSSSGTIPTISSFINSATDVNSRIDITNTQLSKSDITSPTGGSAGTAFHDMTLTADRLIRYALKAINPIKVHNNTLGVQPKGDVPNIEFLIDASTSVSSIPTYTTTISVQNGEAAISDEIKQELVGGRSGQINFEGSLEMSLGKDDVDAKSLMLDTAGSLIAWLGSDRHNRSAIINADGSIMLNIGDYITDSGGKKKFNKNAELAIRVNLVDDQDPSIGELQPGKVANNKLTSDHVIHIGPKGIVISSGNGTPLVLRSSGDILMEAAGTIDMKGKVIQMDSGYLRRIAPKKGDI